MQHRLKHYTLLLLGIIPVIFLSACAGLSEPVSGPGPDMQWSRTFGDGRGVYGNSVQQTTDGGYILCGRTETPSEERVAWLIKTDADGNKLWDKMFNPRKEAWANSVQQTTDGGYIVCGIVTTPKESGIRIHYIWLMKTDADGNKLWDKMFSGELYAKAASVQQTTDGGYIVCGQSDDHVRLIKTDAEGNTIWDKTFVGQYMDIGISVQQTTDGGYIVCGRTVPLVEGWIVGKPSAWLIKTDANGNKIWDKIFDRGYGYSTQQTTDGGYILCGATRFHYGWVIKTDAEGNKLWDKKIGKGAASGNSVQQTADGGYIICGDAYFAGARHILLLKIAPEQ